MIVNRTELAKRGFERALPRIEAQGSFRFRRMKPEAREEAMQEMRALAWKYWLQCLSNGRDPAAFVSKIGEYAAKQAKGGRKLVRMESAKSISNPHTQKRIGVMQYSLEPQLVPLTTALSYSRKVSPADQAQFNVDTRSWVNRLAPKKREMLIDMAMDESTTALAAKYKVTPGRISQIRRELETDYQAFHGVER